MAPMPSTHPLADAPPLDPHAPEGGSQPQQPPQQRPGLFQRRPRFLRAITSPVPSRRDSTDTGLAISSSSSSGEQGLTHIPPPPPSQLLQPSPPVRPRLVALQGDPTLEPCSDDLAGQEGQGRSFSTSVLPPFPPGSGSGSGSTSTLTSVPLSQSRHSIGETLKEHRWSRGLKLNWMSSFSGNSSSASQDLHPSGLSSSSSSSRSQKSVQRRKSEGTGLRILRTDHQGDNIAGLGLTPESAKSASRNSKSGIETSVDLLKVSEARTRRISDSGLSTSSSRLSSSGLAERLSGFAHTVRGISRTSFSAGHSSSTMTSNSTCSTPTTPGFSPQYALDASPATDQPCPARRNSTLESMNRQFETWEDFLLHYRQGRFPADQPLHRPSCGTLFPATLPEYVDPNRIPKQIAHLASPPPLDEERRLRALYSFQILRTGIDSNFERIVNLVATVMGVRSCLVTLVDYDKVWVKAQYNYAYGSIPRENSMCGHTILRAPDDPIVILDTHKDWRFCHLPAALEDPPIRFYAGAPLRTLDGHHLGSLCLVDAQPRTSFSERERALLVDFAAVVMREMELWNDQVQLCIRNRMMRDVTRWVRSCLEISMHNPSDDLGESPTRGPLSVGGPPQPLPTPSDISASSSGVTIPNLAPSNSASGPTLVSTPVDPVFPTPSGSPTLLTRTLGSNTATTPTLTPTSRGDLLEDKAFPAACILIQATLNVDAVYLVQASTHRPVIPPSGSSIVWNYLDASGHRKGSVGVVSGGQVLEDAPNVALVCLASSKKPAESAGHQVLDEKVQQARRQGSSWVCAAEGCRPHRLGDSLLNAVEPAWERDQPIIKEMLGYVRQESTVTAQEPGAERLFSCSQGSDAIESDWFGPMASIPSLKNASRRKMMCHTFQGTLSRLEAGANSPYKSSVVVPILGPPPAESHALIYDQPWAYFVILSSSRTKQFSFHERIYLKNFGSCLITEVLKRRVEAANKAKGVFIKSISHELRTPLHIILGILELLYANPEEPLSENQMMMIASAEASGKSLINTINNIIDLAKLDPDNKLDDVSICGDDSESIPYSSDLLAEMDIRDLCEQVAGSMAKACTDKNLVVIPTWNKPSLSSLATAASSSAPVSASSLSGNSRGLPSPDDPARSFGFPESQSGYSSRGGPLDRKAILELMVAMDEPDKEADHRTPWNFMLNVPVLTRILTQLVENAIKFTATGFVEISAVSPPLSSIPLKPPQPDVRPILFTVRDTGKGISPAFVQSHLFQRFSQEDPLQVGTGLGLALVKLLVENLGGWLEIWSEGIEGKGCVVKVLIWATPAVRPTKSLRDMSGAWQEKSCRFYPGKSSVSSDRLYKIVGERMMGQQLHMTVQRGDELDETAEDILRPLDNASPCDLLVLNDDLPRLQTYLAYWTERHPMANTEIDPEANTPIPLLMITAPSKLKRVRKLVDDYLETQLEINAVERPATIVIMTKPVGPLKLTQCLRDCFVPALSPRGLQTPQGSPRLGPALGMPRPASPLPLLRSATVPHITTLTPQDNRLLSAGNALTSSFVFPLPQGVDMRMPMALIPPHSPGGLVFPHRIETFQPESVSLPREGSHVSTISGWGGLGVHGVVVAAASEEASVSGQESLAAVAKKSIEGNQEESPRVRPQRSIRNYLSQRQLLGIQGSTTTTTPSTSTTTTLTDRKQIPSLTLASVVPSQTATAFPGSDPLVTAITSTTTDRPVPRVLVVEDNITNRMILRTFLKKRGIGVVEAENGQLGVERFREEVWRRQGRQGFEFVLMDLQMPVMDGNLATKRIREFERSMVEQHGLSTPEIASNSSLDDVLSGKEGIEDSTSSASPPSSSSSAPCSRGYRPTIIFALTGLAAEEDKRLAFECGVDGYLTKPVSLKTLGSLLSSCHPDNVDGLKNAAGGRGSGMSSSPV